MNYQGYLLVLSFTLISMSLTGCQTLVESIGLPSMRFDDTSLGNSKIGEILKKAQLWTGGNLTYNENATANNPKDKVYALIAQFIADHPNRQNIAQALNSADLGVTCQNDYCQYQGEFSSITYNIPDKMGQGHFFGKDVPKVLSRKAVEERSIITIQFNPNALAQTYHIHIDTHVMTVENNQRIKNPKSLANQ